MSKQYKILGTIPGQNRVSHHDFVNRSILKVERSGLGYDIGIGIPFTPGNRQVQYITFAGRIQFETTNTFNPGETVYVLYE